MASILKIELRKVNDIVNAKTENDKFILNKVKLLCKEFLHENIVFRGLNDDIVICYYNNIIVGICCIGLKSPFSNFINEIGNKKIPYLYNYICNDNYRSLKPSVALMKYIKNLLNLKGHKEVNLHVHYDNERAKNFYKKKYQIYCSCVNSSGKGNRCY